MKVEIMKYTQGEISRYPEKCYKMSLIFTEHGIKSESTRALTRDNLVEISNRINEELGKNDVASFIYFMYNRWTKEVCKEIFCDNHVCPWAHLWNKYVECAEQVGTWAAPFKWFCELNEELQDILTSYIVQHQDRKKRINNKETNYE